MSRTLVARTLAGALLLLGCWMAYTQSQGGPPPQLTLNRVKDDLYENIEKLRNRAAGLIREGKSQEEVSKVMEAEFGWGPKSMQMQWSLPG